MKKKKNPNQIWTTYSPLTRIIGIENLSYTKKRANFHLILCLSPLVSFFPLFSRFFSRATTTTISSFSFLHQQLKHKHKSRNSKSQQTKKREQVEGSLNLKSRNSSTQNQSSGNDDLGSNAHRPYNVVVASHARMGC